MKTNKNGSSIIITVIISAIILVYYTNCWYSIILMQRVVSEKIEQQKNYRLIESLYFFVLSYCCNNFGNLIKNKDQNKKIITIYSGPWPFNSKIHNGFARAIIKSDMELKIEIALTKQQNKVLCSSAYLIKETIENKKTKKTYSKFTINDWNFEGLY